MGSSLDDEKAGFNLLAAAAGCGDGARLKGLMEGGIGINTRNGIGETALHCACNEGRLSAVQALLEAGADPAMVAAIGQTPLGFAIAGGHFDIAKLLLSKGADADQLIDFDTSPLTLATSNGDAAMVRLLLQHKASVTPRKPSLDDPAPVIAARGGHVGLLRIMHEEFGVSVDLAGERDITPLAAAIMRNNQGSFDYLLEKGADVHRIDMSGDSLLSVAVREDNADAAEVLLRRGLPVDGPGCENLTPLMTAALMDAAKAAKVLLDKGANIDAATPEGMTARVFAEAERHQTTLELIDAETRRRHLIAVEKDAAQAHGGVSATMQVRRPLSFRKPQQRL